MKNYLPRTFWATLLVTTALLAMKETPNLWFDEGVIKRLGGLESSEAELTRLRNIDLLSDLRDEIVLEATDVDQIDTAIVNSLIKVKTEKRLEQTATVEHKPGKPKPVFRDTVKTPDGVVEIEDFGDEALDLGMSKFYEALGQARERQVRIGFFGDSFIEGDILTGWLRALMQQEWGGKGVGYIEIAPETAGFRSTVTHKHKGWKLHQYKKKKTFAKSLQGLGCRYYTGEDGSWVEGTGNKRMYGTKDFDASSFYFRSSRPSTIRLVTNNTDTTIFTTQGSDSLQVLAHTSKTPIWKAHWDVLRADTGSVFYGMAMDGSTGVVLDNISMRGRSGTQLSQMPMPYIRSMQKNRGYDLVVLQFGLNVASEQGRKFTKYQHDMENVVRYMHNAYPEASILVLSVGDRSYKNSSGQMITMPGITNMSFTQNLVAAQTNAAFWNMLKAMQQEGGIDNMAKSIPPLANLDYTHINFRGGRRIAIKLFEALKAGKGRYDREKQFNAKHSN